ncbi:MAG TPA: glycosyltransferase [Chitinophagaceae bacterium]
MKKKSEKPLVVISAVNLTEGGPLSILQDAVTSFAANFISEYRLLLLINNKKLLRGICENDDLKIMEYSYPKRSWFLRIWFEYVHCYFISKKIKAYLWFALHDITPNVKSNNKAVYCHNPAPFYQLSLRDAWIEKSLIFFNFFYSLFYHINIRSNKYVVVQQQWIRYEFEKRYKIKNTVVSYPDVQISETIKADHVAGSKFVFFYPALPRVFKNFETVLDACKILEKLDNDFEMILTFDGSENKYAAKLVKKYKHLASVKFIGAKKREDIIHLYQKSSCLVFASKLETWGLPITEMKLLNKPIIVAKCKYAYETAGDYEKACFFEPMNALQLSELMKKALTGDLEFNSSHFFPPSQPFTKTWKDLFSLILSDTKNN